MNTEKKQNIYQLKVTLDHSSPKVWRRILIPSDSTFFDLHVAIQDAMGWADSHLHGFYIVQKGTARPIMIEFPNPENDPMFGDESLDERIEKIDDQLGVAVNQCKYSYDFGDSWDHTILLERELPENPTASYPQCTAGANACPPEDCGGVWGYQNVQNILKNPRHAEHKDMLDWLLLESADEFDSSHFDLNEIEFENTKTRLKEYEKGFGIKPLRKEKPKKTRPKKRTAR